MAFTTADLENLEIAIRALSTGVRVKAASKGDNSITFENLTKNELFDLRREMQLELGIPTGTRKRFFLISSEKGL